MTEGRMSAVDWRAVGWGALAGFVVIVPLSIAVMVSTPADAEPSDSFALVFLGACALAGAVAGRRRPELPYTHGGLGGLGALVLWVAISAVRDLVVGRAIPFGKIVPSAMLALIFGIIGGLVASRRARRALAEEER